MKVAFLSPVPPMKSGIAHYSAMILPGLARLHDVVVVVDQDEVALPGFELMRVAEFERRAGEFDVVLCQLGNNAYHAFAYEVAMRHAAIVVLHDAVLHHLVVEMTLARGDAGGLRERLSASHGAPGAAIAEARSRGIHAEIANFLYPASGEIAQRSKHVIVHNDWAAGQLRASGVTTPMTVVQHPYEAAPVPGSADVVAARARHGIEPEHVVVGVFGFITEAKRPDAVFEAFAVASTSDPMLRLLWVGEPAHNVDLESTASRHGVERSRWASTGYVRDDEFDLYLAAVDRVVNLRYPSAGETSGALIRVLGAGRPVAVSDYAQFAEFPRNIVTRIPFDDEVDSLSRFMLEKENDPVSRSLAQAGWLRANCAIDDTIAAYDRVLRAAPERTSTRSVPTMPIPLFPSLRVELANSEREGGALRLRLSVTNIGQEIVPSIVYGQPRYVLLVRAVLGDRSVESLVPLPQDLLPGETCVVAASLESGATATRVELLHALGGVDELETRPFVSLEIGS